MKQLENYLDKISRFVELITQIIVVPVTIGFSLVILAGVITRFVLKISFTTSMEFSRIFFVWFCFLGSSLAFKRGQHIQFTFILKKLSGKISSALHICIDLACMTFFCILLVQSIKLAKKVSMTVFPASHISYSVMYISLPIAAFFFIIHTLYFLCRDVNGVISPKGGEQ